VRFGRRAPGGCFGEVALEPHLALEVGEDALDHQPERGKRTFPAEVGGGACPVGSEQPDLVGGESCPVAATPETLVGDHDLGRGAGQNCRSELAPIAAWQISSSCLEGMYGSPSSSNTGSLQNPADFQIKPLD
jgi:hypothetical protein